MTPGERTFGHGNALLSELVVLRGDGDSDRREVARRPLLLSAVAIPTIRSCGFDPSDDGIVQNTTMQVASWSKG